MNVFILYRPKSEFARRAEEYVHDFQITRGKTIELMDVDTVSGTALVELYDAMEQPALLITRENGELINMWQGIESFPVMNDLATQLAL